MGKFGMNFSDVLDGKTLKQGLLKQDRVQWQDLVNMKINFSFYKI